MGFRKSSSIEAAEMGSSAYLASDQTSLLQRPDVLRGGGEGDREGLRKLADRPLPPDQIPQHPASRGIAEGVEDGIKLGGIKFNHVVEY